MEKSGRVGDLIFFSAIAGGSAAPFKTIFHHFLKIPGLFSIYYDEFSYYLIYGQNPLKGFWNWIFGEIGDVIVGACFGIVLGLWLRNSCHKYHFWICMVFGLTMWFATLLFGNVMQIIKHDTISPAALIGHMLTMLIYGVNFFLIARYWKPLKNRIEH